VPDLFQLPGPGRFTAGLASLVREGRSVLVQVPAGQLESVPVLDALAELLQDEGYSCWRLSPEQTPARAIAWSLSVEEEIEGSDPVRLLLAHERLRRSNVFMGEVDSARWPEWQRLLGEFESTAASWDPYERPRMVLLWPIHGVDSRSCRETTLFAVRIWRGWVGELDLKVHVGSVLLGREMTSVQRRLLTEQVVALSLWDRDLADRLLDLEPREFVDPMPVLKAYALQRGWSRQTPVAWEFGTEEVFEGVRQVHSALAALSGQTEIIRRRQWEAQASVVLPLIDRLRRDLIEKGFTYFRRVLPGVTRPADLYDLDIGSLWHELRKGGPKDLTQWAERLRWYRNELSHLRPLRFDQLYDYRGWPA
jgi:hypothetical protein